MTILQRLSSLRFIEGIALLLLLVTAATAGIVVARRRRRSEVRPMRMTIRVEDEEDGRR